MPLKITSKKDGFRRAGQAHSKEPCYYPAGHFNEQQMTMLMAEPMLTLEILPEKPEESEESEEMPPESMVGAIHVGAIHESPQQPTRKPRKR